MSLRDKLKSRGGFSLVEVIVATVVLAIVMAPVGTCLATAFRINASADRRMQNQLLASSAIETLMAEGIPNTKSESNPVLDLPIQGINAKIVAKDDASGAYEVEVRCGSGADEVAFTTWIHPDSGGAP